MDKMEHKRFQAPDETREFPPGRAEIRSVGGMQAGRLILEPGWRWPADVGPTAMLSADHGAWVVGDEPVATAG
jgi:hypothetical protein